MITYTIHAPEGQHDTVLEKVQKEVRKDKYWIDSKLLPDGIGQQEHAIQLACDALGFELMKYSNPSIWVYECSIMGSVK